MRFDVGRRVRHCLCVITRHNRPSFYRLLLLYLHSLLLFSDADISPCVSLLQTLSSQKYPARGGVLAASDVVRLSVPLQATHSYVSSLPLLQSMGSTGLLTLLAVCLNERRVVFTADEVMTWTMNRYT